MIRRFFYAIFFMLGGFLFAIPKWILLGTRASRERKKILKQQREILSTMHRPSVNTDTPGRASSARGTRLSLDAARRDARKQQRVLSAAGVTWDGRP